MTDNHIRPIILAALAKAELSGPELREILNENGHPIRLAAFYSKMSIMELDRLVERWQKKIDIQGIQVNQSQYRITDIGRQNYERWEAAVKRLAARMNVLDIDEPAVLSDYNPDEADLSPGIDCPAPDRWPQNMRGHHLRETTRDAYWDVRDAERVAEQPIADMMVFTMFLVVAVFFAAIERHWIGYGVTAAFALGWLIVVRISLRERKKLLPKVQAARERLEELKSKGGEVRL